MDLWSLVGGIASMIGAAIAWRSAGQAQTAAEAARGARDELRHRSRLSELSELVSAQRRAVAAMDKFGPGSSVLSTRGTDANNDASHVRNYLQLVQQNREHFGLSSQLFCDKVYDLLEGFPELDDADQRDRGTRIFRELTQFSPRLKAVFDHHRDDGPIAVGS